MFYGCSNLTSVRIPDGVTSIGDFAFHSCASLTNITIPNTVSSIGLFAFLGCSRLTGVSIPNSVTVLGPYAFCGCTSLTELTVPGSVTEWRALTYPAALGYAPWTIAATFAGCTNLRTVAVESGVTNVPAGTFTGCSNLVSITLPQSVTGLGTIPVPHGISEPVFKGCIHLTGIYFEGACPVLLSGLGASAATTVYYLPGTTGWGATYGGCPTSLWTPQLQAMDSSFAAATNGFGFTVTWARGKVVTVEACTNLVNPIWSPVQSITLTNGSSYFTDPEQTSYRGRFYRIRSL